MTRITIVEDHGLIAHTLAAALTGRGHEAHPVDPDAEPDLLQAVLDEGPELVLLDLDLGDAGEATGLVADLTASDVPVLMVTGVDDPARRAACVAAGAIGVLDKSGSFDDVVAAIETVTRTGSLLTRHERDEHLATLRDTRRAERDRLAPFAELTPREAEVLGELIRGRTVDDIAARSFVSKETVRTQVRAIRTKLGVHTQLAAIALARDVGWTPPPPAD